MSTGAKAGVCNSKGQLNPAVAHALTTLAGCLNAQHEQQPTAWTLIKANEFAQKHLLRPPGRERLDKEAVTHYQAIFSALDAKSRQQIEDDLAQAGFLDAVAPPRVPLDYILLNGSTAQNVRSRIHALARAVDSGVITLLPQTQILCLDGQRSLFASETPKVLLDPSPYEKEPTWSAPKILPRDERDMTEMVWAQMRLPKALRDHGITFVHAKKQPDASRAQTADCVAEWVRLRNPKSGTLVVLSKNPFIEYQSRVTAVVLAQSGANPMKIVAMGPAADFSDDMAAATRLGVLLDALASTLCRAAQQETLGLLQ